MKSLEERQRTQRLARENKLRNKLANNDVHQRQLANQKRSNDAKQKRIAELRSLGIKPIMKPLSERDKERMRVYAKRKRDEARLLRIKRVPLTDEQRRFNANERSRKSYEKKLAMQGKVRQVPVKKRSKEHKTKPMEKILKARPANRISEKVIKPVKLDHAKQPDVIVIKSNEDGKVKVRLNAKTEVWAKPGYDINALRRKFGII